MSPPRANVMLRHRTRGALMVRALVTASALLAAAAAVSTACGDRGGGNPTPAFPVVSKDALRKEISDKLTAAGVVPRAVNCSDDLAGQVGKTSTCDVDLGPANRIHENIRVTDVTGTRVTYDTTPSQTQAQLDESVRADLGRAGTKGIDSVSCETGLDGTTGSTAFCNVTAGGATFRQMLRVDASNGVTMTYRLVPHLAKADVEDSLRSKLQQQLGKRPNVASCAGDLQGLPNATVDCDALVDDEPRTFTLTVTTVDGSAIDYRVAPKN